MTDSRLPNLTSNFRDFFGFKNLSTAKESGGSASDAVRNGGAGIYIHEIDGSTKVPAEATGVYCTNYRAEVEALIIDCRGHKQKYLSRIPDCIFHRRIVCSAGF